MTPEQDKKLDAVLVALERVASAQLATNQRMGKIERRFQHAMQWLRILISERKGDPSSIRPPMPSLSAEDSGSFEIKAFGAEAAFKGAVAMRFAIVLAGILLVAGAGYAMFAITHPAQAATEGKQP